MVNMKYYILYIIWILKRNREIKKIKYKYMCHNSNT